MTGASCRRKGAAVLRPYKGEEGRAEARPYTKKNEHGFGSAAILAAVCGERKKEEPAGSQRYKMARPFEAQGEHVVPYGPPQKAASTKRAGGRQVS